ncbi:methyltransferase [Prauserella marina]|uniref:Methyltransferase domain-containing protein n=1 Tax=Prauserella marina TaxID=530584 RepID=A0A222VR10_9PSEU|nr:class I SAM-dependent methyltransferase [Prauserella marina]ASR36348.1 methyltransferase [Prauserella marina]PWV77138.1 methyltransferase family protein [Prauserella marina]SDD05314.1 Methyltransferase domain-containing protein [Prauserella marina]
MSGIVNTGQAEAWNGYEGEHWARHDDRYDAVNGGFNEPVLQAARIADDSDVLDVGCGNGQLTRLAARRAARGKVTGIDLSEPMLHTARERAKAEQLGNLSFERGDAQVHPFADDSYDVALSRFGVMFFADPVAAFANIARALRPGGRIAFVCMTELAGTDLGTVFGAMAPYVPQPTGPDGTGPTSFGDPRKVEAVLGEAGFTGIDCTRVETEQTWGASVEDAGAFIADWGPVRHHLREAGQEAAEKAKAALAGVLATFATPDAVRTRGTAWLVTATTRNQ